MYYMHVHVGVFAGVSLGHWSPFFGGGGVCDQRGYILGRVRTTDILKSGRRALDPRYRLLSQMLPPHILARLKNGEEVPTDIPLVALCVGSACISRATLKSSPV